MKRRSSSSTCSTTSTSSWRRSGGSTSSANSPSARSTTTTRCRRRCARRRPSATARWRWCATARCCARRRGSPTGSKAIDEAVQVLGRMRARGRPVRDDGDRPRAGPEHAGAPRRRASNDDAAALTISTRAVEAIRPLATRAERLGRGAPRLRRGAEHARVPADAEPAARARPRGARRSPRRVPRHRRSRADRPGGSRGLRRGVVVAGPDVRGLGRTRRRQARRQARALAVAAKVLDKRPGHMQALRAQALATSPLSGLLADEMRLAEALAMVDATRRAWSEFVRIDPSNAISWSNLAVSHFIKANIQEAMGRPGDAAATWRSTQALEAQGPANLMLKNSLGLHAGRLALLEAQRGKRREAEAGAGAGRLAQRVGLRERACGLVGPAVAAARSARSGPSRSPTPWATIARRWSRAGWPRRNSTASSRRCRVPAPGSMRLPALILHNAMATSAYAIGDFAAADREMALVLAARKRAGRQRLDDPRRRLRAARSRRWCKLRLNQPDGSARADRAGAQVPARTGGAQRRRPEPAPRPRRRALRRRRRRRRRPGRTARRGRRADGQAAAGDEAPVVRRGSGATASPRPDPDGGRPRPARRDDAWRTARPTPPATPRREGPRDACARIRGHLAQGAPWAGCDAFRDAVAQHPDDAELLYCGALAHARAGATSEAHALLDRAQAAAPDCAGAAVGHPEPARPAVEGRSSTARRTRRTRRRSPGAPATNTSPRGRCCATRIRASTRRRCRCCSATARRPGLAQTIAAASRRSCRRRDRDGAPRPVPARPPRRPAGIRSPPAKPRCCWGTSTRRGNAMRPRMRSPPATPAASRRCAGSSCCSRACCPRRQRCCRSFPRADVVAFTGHMIDAPDRATPRFPAALVPAVAAAVRERLARMRRPVFYGSAACGADLIVIEAALALGAEVNVVLPFDRDDFVRTSVAVGGARLAAALRRRARSRDAGHPRHRGALPRRRRAVRARGAAGRGAGAAARVAAADRRRRCCA